MNNSTRRIGLSAIAAFYVVFGGLWAADYFPLHGYYNDMKAQDGLYERLGFEDAYKSAEYKEVTARQEAYVLGHSGILETEKKLALLQAILLWGTVGLGVAGGVLYVTRGRRRAIQEAVQ